MGQAKDSLPNNLRLTILRLKDLKEISKHKESV